MKTIFPNAPPMRRPHAKLRSPQSEPAQLSLLFDVSPSEPAHVAPDQYAPAIPHPSITPPATPLPRIAPPAKTKDHRQISLGTQIISYQLKRSTRKSIGFLIDDGGLRVTAPRWVGLNEIENSVREKERWILTKLASWQERSTRRALPTMHWECGATIPYLGGPLVIELGADHTALTSFEQRHTLRLNLPQQANTQQIKDRVQAWLQGEARRIFDSRLEHYLTLTGWCMSGWALSSATTQWGSCTAEGKVRLNWRLIHFDLSVIDYVIAHELAHLQEMNHSPRFWKIVASLFPDYHAARNVLRHQDPQLLPELF